MQRNIIAGQHHAFYISFSCHRGRKLLDDDAAKDIVVHFLCKQLKKQWGNCMGFVVMPDHVHALVQFEQSKNLSVFIGQWKRRSSTALKSLHQINLYKHGTPFDSFEPIWQPNYYAFNIYSPHKAKEKMAYMHDYPVSAGLVAKALDWRYSSARWYLMNRSVGVPLTRVM